jgi:hypothetical protein
MRSLAFEPADEGKGVKPPLTPEASPLKAGQLTGLNIMESYGIHIENDEIKFKHIPPTSMII